MNDIADGRARGNDRHGNFGEVNVGVMSERGEWVSQSTLWSKREIIG
jgi:hypothetical protein